MDRKKPEDVIDLLKGPILTVRVGLWLYPIYKQGQERDDAALLGIDAIDMKNLLIENLPKGTVYSGITSNKIVEMLQTVSGRRDLSRCVLVYNFDLILSYLLFSERLSLWDVLYNGFPHKPRGLLILIPETAHELLPAENRLFLWGKEGRLA